MSQLQTVPGDHQALPEMLRRGRRRQGEVALTTEQSAERSRIRQRIVNQQLFSVPPIDQECDCGQPATMWSSGKDAICARCDFLYSFAKRMEVQGRVIGLHRAKKFSPEVEPTESQLELFHAEIIYLADEITIEAHGVYHLRLEAT